MLHVGVGDSYGASPDKCSTQHPFAYSHHGGHKSFFGFIQLCLARLFNTRFFLKLDF